MRLPFPLNRGFKWLKPGVMEEGRVYRPETGVPQGGVISPILSNIYLHEVLEQWFAKPVKPRLQGQASPDALRQTLIACRWFRQMEKSAAAVFGEWRNLPSRNPMKNLRKRSHSPDYG